VVHKKALDTYNIIYNITSMAYNHHTDTDIYTLKHINPSNSYSPPAATAS